MRLKFLAVLAGALLMTVPAFAGPTSFCSEPSGTGPTDIGASEVVSGITITGWSGTSTTTANTQVDLSCKNESVGEAGLGLMNDSDGEINSHSFVQLDLGNLHITSLTIESIQSNEGFTILGSSMSGVLGTDVLGSGSGLPVTQSVTINTAGIEFVDIKATSGNVLLSSFTATPEPSTYFLMGTGLLMLGFIVRRKFASASC